MGHVVRCLENMVLVGVDLAHALVLDLVDSGILLFDEVLDTLETDVHVCD